MNKKIRQEFADTMFEIGKKDPNLVVFVADISHYILQPFEKACPGRYYNIGICEPTMVNMAAGLSKLGFHPVVHTFAPFLLERSFEQIKIDFGYQKLGVNLVASGSGFDYGYLGCTHHCYDDFALLKNIENMQVIHPASPKEFNLLFKQTYNNKLPNYFRIPENSHEINLEDKEIVVGKAIKIKEGKDISIIVTGPQLKTAIDAINILDSNDINPEIIYVHTIKPFDKEMVNKSLEKTKKGLIIEEHSMYGGLLEEVLRYSKNLGEIKYSSINIGDKFIRNYGSYQDHCERLGFSVKGIEKKVNELF